ncbi:MAG: hypothetical protein JNK90_07330 [Planctomycetaceae bacterium]|nr:hypothetical protein [Planctomycetaceae bacterium]
MPYRLRYALLILAGAVTVGCSPSASSHSPHVFLGVAEDETSGEGPVGLLNGEAIQVHTVSKVKEAAYEEYLRAKKDAKIVAEENYNGFIYWATKESRDVPFENATAWVTVLERYRTKSR